MNEAREPVELNKSVVCLAFIVYFIQGALGIANIALPLFIRGHGYTVEEITFILSLSTVPWFLKIFYGALSDSFPIFGLRRKPYLVICSVVSSIGWVVLFLSPPSMAWLIVALTISNLGLAATDVITDGLVVENSLPGSAQVYQSISWGARSVGALLAGVLGGYLAQNVQHRYVFLMTGILPLFTLLAAMSVAENRRAGVENNFMQTLIESFKFLFRSELGWFTVLFMIAALPVSFGTPLFFYLNESLGFDAIFLGILSSVTWGGAILGCLIYIKLFKTVAIRKALYWAIVINFVQVLSVLLIQDRVSAGTVAFLGGVLGYICILPFFSASAKLCHGTGFEGSLFAIIASFYNASQAVFKYLGGKVSMLMPLPVLIIVTAFLGLTAFAVMRKLKSV